jgi:hypothetical protein
MFVKPGHRPEDPSQLKSVRKPNFRLLSLAGEEVGDSTFWHRRLRDGDVVLAEPPLPATPEQATGETAT